MDVNDRRSVEQIEQDPPWLAILALLTGIGLLLIVGVLMVLGSQDPNRGGQGGMTPPSRVQPSPYGPPPSNRGQVPDPGLRPSPQPGIVVVLPG